MKEVTSQTFSNGIAKSIAILFAISVAARVCVAIFSGERVPDYTGGTGRFIGQMIGGGATIFAVAILFFFVVRFYQGRNAGQSSSLIAGIVAAVAMAALMLIGSR